MRNNSWDLLIKIGIGIVIILLMIWSFTPGSFPYRYSRLGNRWDVEKLEKKVDSLERELRSVGRLVAENSKLIKQLRSDK